MNSSKKSGIFNKIWNAFANYGFNKKVFLNSFIIVLASVLIGFFYNFLLPQPLSLIYHKEIIKNADNSELFSNSNSQNSNQISSKTNKSSETASLNVQKVNENLKIDSSKQIISSKNNTEKSINTIPKKKDTLLSSKDLHGNISENSKTNPNQIKNNNKNTPNENNSDLNGQVKYKSVNYEQMKQIIKSTDFVIIDARNQDEFVKGHIPKAINIFALDEPNIKVPKIYDLPTNKKIIVYCDGGNCDLSHELAKELIQVFGFKDVYIYSGGWEDWTQHNG